MLLKTNARPLSQATTYIIFLFVFVSVSYSSQQSFSAQHCIIDHQPVLNPQTDRLKHTLDSCHVFVYLSAPSLCNALPAQV